MGEDEDEGRVSGEDGEGVREEERRRASSDANRAAKRR